MERISMSDINVELMEAIESGVSYAGLENILTSYGFPVEVFDSIIEGTLKQMREEAALDTWLETNVQEEIYSPYYGA
jgi:hypothetical protein